MKIELSSQQEREVREGRTVEVVDPASQRTFILLARDQFDRVRHLLENGAINSTAEIATGIPPGIRLSQESFWRELPKLLRNKKNRGKWVCYHGKDCLGIGTYKELIGACLRREIREDQYYLDLLEERSCAPWEVEEVEPLGPNHLEEYPATP